MSSEAVTGTPNAEAIVECVPNFSEGVDRDKVEQIVRAMRVEGVHLLDYSLDADHNRSVVTIAGSPEAVVEAAVRGAGKAAELIDLTQQSGAHPRIGAADVIPFVPVSGLSLVQCAMLARQAGLGDLAQIRRADLLLRGCCVEARQGEPGRCTARSV
jgi:glutamate formiminotransferase